MRRVAPGRSVSVDGCYSCCKCLVKRRFQQLCAVSGPLDIFSPAAHIVGADTMRVSATVHSLIPGSPFYGASPEL